MPIAGTGAIEFQARALELQAERGRVLASNIANADTPNYKARDFNFAQALAQAAGSAAVHPGSAVAVARTQPGHLGGAAGTAPGPALQYRAPLQSSIDGNTVDLDVERANFAENSVKYEATLRFMNAYYKQMSTAINGQ